MKIQYANELIQNMGLSDPTTCVYEFIFDENYSDDTKSIQYFIMNGLGLCIKLNSFLEHMFYAFSFSHNTVVPIFYDNCLFSPQC